MYLDPLRFRKYGHATFLEVNVICAVVMYTNKVLRACHMLMLDNTFWAERLTGNTVCGSLGCNRWSDGLVQSQGPESLLFWTRVLLGLFWVLLFSPNAILAETNLLDLSSDSAVKYKHTEIKCHSHRRFNKHFEFSGIMLKYQTEGCVLLVTGMCCV